MYSTTPLETYLKEFEHRGAPPRREDVERLLEIIRVQDEYLKVCGEERCAMCCSSINARAAQAKVQEICE